MGAQECFALNVRAPWAQLIMSGKKRYEVRGYDMPRRGPLVIVSSMTRPAAGLLAQLGIRQRDADRFLYGHAIGMVDLIDARPARTGDERFALCPVRRGQYVWILANPRPIQPFAQEGRCKPYRIDPKKVIPINA